MFSRCGTDRKPYQQTRVFTFIVAGEAQHLALPFYFIKMRGHSTTNSCPHSNNPLSHKNVLVQERQANPWARVSQWEEKKPLILLGAPTPAKRRRFFAQHAALCSGSECLSLNGAALTDCCCCCTCAASSFQRLMGIQWFVWGFDHSRPAAGSKRIAYSFCHFISSSSTCHRFLHWFNQQKLPSGSFDRFLWGTGKSF